MRWFAWSAWLFTRFAVGVAVSTVLAGLLLDGLTELDETTCWTFAYYAGLLGTSSVALWLATRGGGTAYH